MVLFLDPEKFFYSMELDFRVYPFQFLQREGHKTNYIFKLIDFYLTHTHFLFH